MRAEKFTISTVTAAVNQCDPGRSGTAGAPPIPFRSYAEQRANARRTPRAKPQQASGDARRGPSQRPPGPPRDCTSHGPHKPKVIADSHRAGGSRGDSLRVGTRPTSLPMRGRPARDGPARLACWAAVAGARERPHAAFMLYYDKCLRAASLGITLTPLQQDAAATNRRAA